MAEETETEVAQKKFFTYLSHFEGPLPLAVQQGLSIGPQLNSLSIRGLKSGVKLTDELVKVLCVGLVQCGVGLQALQLKFHSITDIGAAEIASLVINPSSPLQLLDLEGNDINTPSSLKIFDNNCDLKVLDLSYNPLGEIGGLELSSFIHNNRKLQSLSVSGSNLNLKASIGLITSLHDNNVLEGLGMDKPLLNFSKQEEVTDHISRVLLDKSSGLRELSLRFHGLQDRGARLLSDALSRNLILTHINLESNKICVAGAEALASVLILQHRQKQADPRARRNYIQSIKLSHNFICDEGALALAEAIRCNTSLREISLRSNRIGREGLVALAEALHVSNSLESLQIFGNDFEQESGGMFHELINNRLKYTGMQLDIDVYVVDGTYMIADKQ